MDERLRIAEQAVARARRRLRLRGLVRGGAIGLHAAAWFVLGVVAIGRLAALPVLGIAAAGMSLVSIVVAVAALTGALRPVPDARGLALLVDRLGRTQELVLTALHVAGTTDPNRASILARLSTASVPDARRLLPVALPRHLRFAPIPALLAALALWLVPPALGPWNQPSSPVAQEGRRLEQRLKELATDAGVEMPAPLERELATLAEELSGDDLSQEEARQRLTELQDKLAELQKALAPSTDLLQDLEQAAQALDGEATDALGDALAQGDFERAADAAKDLQQSLSEASPAERERAADALKQAGEALARSADPTLQRAGESLREAGAQLGQEGGTAEGGSPGSEGGDGALAQDLAQQLAEARSLGEQLARDKEALDRSQQLSGALEGSRQRLGGEPSVDQGQSSGQPGAGSEGGAGDGGGEGAGTGSGATTAAGVGPGAGPQAGVGHTWEDQGAFDSRGGGDETHGDRNDARTTGQQIDDFRKLYAAQRLEGAQSLLAGVDGQLDSRGKVDQLPVRLTSGEEDAVAPAVDLPARYRAEASEAIEGETVPPAYEHAVKEYFDQMK